MYLVFLLFIASFLAFGQGNTLGREAPEEGQKDLRLWKISAVVLTAASAFDVASSWGKCCERNGLLASADRRFGGRGLAVKSGAVGGQLLMQYLVARRSPKLARVLGYVNFAGAGALTVVGIHNLRVPQPAARR